MNSVQKGVHIFVQIRLSACTCARARDRRRLKRSPISIVLAINVRLLQPRLFIYPCRTRDSALSTPTRTPVCWFVRPSVRPSVRSFSTPFFIIPRSRVGVTSFFQRRASVFFTCRLPDNSSWLHFRSFPMTTLVSDSS